MLKVSFPSDGNVMMGAKEVERKAGKRRRRKQRDGERIRKQKSKKKKQQKIGTEDDAKVKMIKEGSWRTPADGLNLL